MTTTPPIDPQAPLDTIKPAPLPEPLFDLLIEGDDDDPDAYACRLCGAIVGERTNDNVRRDLHRRFHEDNRHALTILTTMVRGTYDGINQVLAAIDDEAS
jgi:hypothetical protein